jgi:hypothetical protein
MTAHRLRFSLDRSRRVESRVAIAQPESLLKNILFRGIETFELDWSGLFVVELFVEDDAQFLADAYLDLEDDKWQALGCHHEIILGDGLLHVRSTIADESVAMAANYVPHLDKRFLKTRHISVSRERYLFAWRDLAAQLGSLGSSSSGQLREFCPPQQADLKRGTGGNRRCRVRVF